MDWYVRYLPHFFVNLIGEGAVRRLQFVNKGQETQGCDVQVVEANALDQKVASLKLEEDEWSKKMETIWVGGIVPPLLEWSPASSKPGDIQDDFRVKMLEYWAAHPSLLKYSDPVEPINQGREIFLQKFKPWIQRFLGALEVLRYHAGHRDAKG